MVQTLLTEAAGAAAEAGDARDSGDVDAAAIADARAVQCNTLVATLQDPAKLELVCMNGINADGTAVDGRAGGRRRWGGGGAARG